SRLSFVCSSRTLLFTRSPSYDRGSCPANSSPTLTALMSHDESAPLLANDTPHPTFPTISEALMRLDNNIGWANVNEVCPADTDRSRETAFRMVVLLALRTHKLRQQPDTDMWNRHQHDISTTDIVNSLDGLALQTWSTFLEDYRSAAEIEQVLWSPFVVDDLTPQSLRVVDLLCTTEPECSPLVCHDLVVLSIIHTWKHGFSSGRTEIGARYEAMSTPRALHLIDLITHLAYFGLLVSYVMRPPPEPLTNETSRPNYIGAREILLILFSGSILTRTWNAF
ncbi:unnamed protein product, partial [Mycena citricolor]